MILTKEQIERGEHLQFNPDRHDFIWNADFSECEVVVLLWWNESSYQSYQGDSYEN